MAHRGWRIRKKKNSMPRLKPQHRKSIGKCISPMKNMAVLYAVRYICICVYTLSDPIAAVTQGVGLNDAYALRNKCIINRCISLCLFLCVYQTGPRARLRICAL